MDTIDVIVEGGVIQDILGIPSNCRIRVIDYDTDGAPDEELSKSPYDNENKCFLSIWKWHGRRVKK